MSNEWIEWAGGDCPVNGDAEVEFRLRGAKPTVSVKKAENLRWNHINSPTDIVAYRLHVPQQASARQVAGTHYKAMGVEPWDVVDTWPLEQRIGAYRHGALKYLMRMGSKDESAQEIAKGIHYMEKLLEVLKA